MVAEQKDKVGPFLNMSYPKVESFSDNMDDGRVKVKPKVHANVFC